VRFQELLSRSVRGVWVTSYSFGLRLFDQYILRTVSQGALNAVVLADQEKLAEVWRNLPEREEHLARRAGHRYLLRGVAQAGAAFHPKTYLLARSDGATLVVGSGNLTREGIDRGHEAFARFDSTRDEDLPSMRAWAEWMARLVEQQDDEILLRRWRALREESPWMIGSSEGASFIANYREPILAQFGQRLQGVVTELHVTAPFFDRDASALAELIRTVDPARVELYLGAGTKVRGPSLAAVLGEARAARVRRYEPHTFVHAKLIGAIEDVGRGVLIVGSPNLSTAALLRRCGGDERGNWEAAVFREGSDVEVRTAFTGDPRLTLTEVQTGEIDALEFEEDEAPASGLADLLSATWCEDGRIATRCAAETETLVAGALAWTGGRAPLAPDGVTAEPLAEDERPLLVWLAAANGTPLTNKVPVDDPAALEQALLGGRAQRGSRPTELQGIEDSPLVKIALWAHEKFIFDPEHEPAFHRAREAVPVSANEEAGEFWERYAQEELRYDPRSRSYQPLTPSSGESPIDELLRELRRLLDAAPGAPISRLRIITTDENEEAAAEPEPGTRWSMDARQRRRAFNLFLRWTRAVADPRHMLLDPNAPVVNYETLLGVVLAAWAHEALGARQLRTLLLTLLTSFVGNGERQPGFLGRITGEEQGTALAHLDPFAMELGAGLAAVALNSGWRGKIYEWQPVLRRSLEFDVLLPGQWSVRVVHHLLGKNIGPEGIAALLQERLEFVDEETWCDRMAAELGFESISLDLHREARVRSWIFVRGASDPLTDMRLLSLARRFLEFKDVPAVAVKTDGDEVMIFEPGKQARARLDGLSRRSPEPVTMVRLQEIERQGGTWADLLGGAGVA
jgi:hypothetical protein